MKLRSGMNVPNRKKGQFAGRQSRKALHQNNFNERVWNSHAIEGKDSDSDEEERRSAEVMYESDEEKDHSVPEEEKLEDEMDESANQDEAEFDRTEFPQQYKNYEGESINDTKLLIFMDFVINEGLSKSAIYRLEMLMTALYDQTPPITSKDVIRQLDTMEQSCIKKIDYFCRECGTRKTKKLDKCSQCSRQKGKVSDTVTFIEADIAGQIQRMLQSYGQDIVNAHKRIHYDPNGTSRFEVTDARRFPAYRDAMETREEFDSNIINCIVTLSTDGAVFKRLSRREAIPILIRPEGFDPSLNSVLLVGLAFSEHGIMKGMIDRFVELVFRQLKNLNIRVKIDNEHFLFKLKVLTVILDMKESKSLCGLPNWYASKGCIKCETVGLKKQNGHISYNNPSTFNLRTNHSVRVSSACGRDGFQSKKMPHIFDFIDPVTISIDPFHLKGAGICKRILAEINTPNKWKSAKLKSGRSNLITSSLESIGDYTYSSSKIKEWNKLGMCTGREVERTCVFVAAIVAFSKACKNENFNVFCMGMLFSLHFTGTTTAAHHTLQELQDAIYALIVELEPSEITIKIHTYFKHCVAHEEYYGPLMTTEIFERHHKSFMTSLNGQATNCERLIVSRFIAKEFVAQNLDYYEPMLSDRFGNLIRNARKQSSQRIFDNGGFLSGNRMDHHSLVREHSELLKAYGLDRCLLLKRAPYRSHYGNFVLSSQYWKSKSSTQSEAAWRDPTTGLPFFGRVEVLLDHRNRRFAVCRRYNTEPIQQTIANLYPEEDISANSRKVLNLCTQLPVLIAKLDVIEKTHTLVPIEYFLCPVIKFVIGDFTYLKIYR